MLSLVGVGVFLIGSPAPADGPSCLDVSGRIEASRGPSGDFVGEAHLQMGARSFTSLVTVEVLEGPHTTDTGETRARLAHRFRFDDGSMFRSVEDARLSAPSTEGSEYDLESEGHVDESAGAADGYTGQLLSRGSMNFTEERSSLDIKGRLCGGGAR